VTKTLLVALALLLAGAAHAEPLSDPPLQPAAPPEITEWMSLERLQETAHQAGLKAIFDTWQTYVTSTTKETYPAYYGRVWDTANRPANAPPPPAPKVDETKKSTVVDAARLARITTAMARTKTGRAALEVMTKQHVRIEFIQNSNAGYFSPSKNFIALGDARQGPDEVNTLLHEINHAFTTNTGNAANVRASRQAYVDGKIADEARSDGIVAVANRELSRMNRRAQKSGGSIPMSIKQTTPLYLDAYKKVIFEGRAARVANPRVAMK
jgi:hypothetical protein